MKQAQIEISDSTGKQIGYRVKWISASPNKKGNEQLLDSKQVFNDTKAVKKNILSAVNTALKVAGCDTPAALGDLSREFIKDFTAKQLFVKSGFATSGTNPHGFVLAPKTQGRKK